jgi:hypothetical protein
MGSEDDYSPWAMLIFMAGPLPETGLESIIHASFRVPCLSMLSEWILFLIYYKLGFDFPPNLLCMLLKNKTLGSQKSSWPFFQT